MKLEPPHSPSKLHESPVFSDHSSPSQSLIMSKLTQSIQLVVAQDHTPQICNDSRENPRVAYITDTLRNYLGAGENDVLLAGKFLSL